MQSDVYDFRPDSATIVVNCDEIIYTRRLEDEGLVEGNSQSRSINLRQDKLCRNCYITIQSIQHGGTLLKHRQPGTAIDEPPDAPGQLSRLMQRSLCIFFCNSRAVTHPKPKVTPLEETPSHLSSLIQCSLCTFFCNLGTGIHPNASFTKATPLEARGSDQNNSHIPTPSPEDIIILSDSTYRGQTTAISDRFDAAGNLEYANQVVLVPHEQLSGEKVRSWLHRCESEHGECCNGVNQGFRNKYPLELTVIDVHKKCLVKVTSETRYMALSYVWGNVQQLQCRKANVKSLSKEGGLLDWHGQIPTVIMDAMALTASAGESFLWVDSLCIVQDDEAIKALQISRMATIYSAAVLTIVAVSGNSANDGLPGVQNGSRAMHAQRLPAYPGLLISKRTPWLLDAIRKSTYHSRAWTFQEQLLSRRCLFFLEDQVYFQCSSTIWCEDRNVDYAEDLQQLNPMIRFAKEQAVHTSDSENRVFNLYSLLVSEYLQKNLTQPSDIVFAFSGIIEKLQDSCSWKFTHGIPENTIDAAMLWCPTQTNLRRRGQAVGEKSPGAGREPSWSWTGWHGTASYEATIAWGGRLNSRIYDLALLDTNSLRFIQRDVQPSEKIDTIGTARRLSIYENFREEVQTSHICNSIPPGISTALIFPTSAISIGAFRCITESVIWKPPRIKPFPVHDGQTVQRLHDRNGYLCGGLYGSKINGVAFTEQTDVQLLALSDLEYTPKLPYVVAKPGVCWKDCCAQNLTNQIFDTGQFEERNWCVINVLAVKEHEVHSEMMERVAVGHLHVDAWERASPNKKIIWLV